MPQVFKMGPYLVYFWSNENEQKQAIAVGNSIKTTILMKGVQPWHLRSNESFW